MHSNNKQEGKTQNQEGPNKHHHHHHHHRKQTINKQKQADKQTSK